MAMKLVYLNDGKLNHETPVKHFHDAADWAKKNCKSFINYHIQDVSDVSVSYDQIAEYKFNDKKDAIWFELRWK